jgi:hypothetical protein
MFLSVALPIKTFTVWNDDYVSSFTLGVELIGTGLNGESFVGRKGPSHLSTCLELTPQTRAAGNHARFIG